MKQWGGVLAVGLVLALAMPAWAQEMIFHGYIDFEARNQDHAGRAEGIFDNHHFNLFLGSELADNLRAQGEIEFEHTTGVKVEFAQIEWKPLYNDLLELWFGYFVVPFGVEHRVHASPRNKLVSRPSPSRAIVPGTFSDAGILATGVLPLGTVATLNYNGYVINGLKDGDRDGVFEQSNVKGSDSRDINDDKSFGLQLNLIPLAGVETRGIEVGGSLLAGKWDVWNDNDYVMWGVHGVVNFEPFELRAEFNQLNVDNPGVGTLSEATLNGWYVQGSWAAHPLVELIARYDAVDNDDGLPSIKEGPTPITTGTAVDEGRITVGVRFTPQEWLAFKLEYFNRSTDNRATNAPQEDGIGFQAVANW
ncbi:MAG: porin [Candidatus Methylomirabilales bacterium]